LNLQKNRGCEAANRSESGLNPLQKLRTGKAMAQDNSFDIVSKVDIQEVRNAIDQALKEIKAALRPQGLEVRHHAGRRQRDSACFGRRVQAGSGQGNPRPEAGQARRLAQKPELRQAGRGDGQERPAEDHAAAGRPDRKGQGHRPHRQGLKKVQASIQGDSVRVSGKDRDSLQSASRFCVAKIWAWICSSPTTGRIDEHFGRGNIQRHRIRILASAEHQASASKRKAQEPETLSTLAIATAREVFDLLRDDLTAIEQELGRDAVSSVEHHHGDCRIPARGRRQAHSPFAAAAGSALPGLYRRA
jgi:hypothetical protein